MKRVDNPVRMFFLLFVVALVIWLIFNMGNQLSIVKLNSTQFNAVVEEGNIGLIEIRQNSQTPTGEAIIHFNNEKGEVHYFISDVNEFTRKMDSSNITYILEDVPRDSVFTNTILPIGLTAVMIMFFIVYMNGRIAAGGSGNNKMMNFGKSRARIVKTTNVNFSIDEIDAVGRRRGSGLGGSHDEREQTLNQLLVEMDGFAGNQGIIVMAATNRVDILDPALLRPGRFDRKVAVGRPDVAAREAILKIHVSSKPLADDVDLHSVARQTSGFTGADLENLMNEAAILSAREGKAYISSNDINRAFIKVGIGTEKKSRIVSEKEKAITAYHEAGHAILFRELEGVGPVHTISIIPTGVSAAGYTMPLPSEDKMFHTKSGMLNDIMVSLGGRIAEEIIFGDITTGASSDIKQATKVAKAMVMEFGMNERAGLVNYGNEGDEIFIGRDFGQTKAYSEETENMIDEEIRNIINDCYKKAREIILKRKYVLESCAALLIEKEKIGFEEFEALF